jgi:non-canonical (house-cleaning) NTP pyrophosphatase
MSNKLVFHDKRESKYEAVAGVGTITVTVDFMPNFIEVVFSDVQTSKTTQPMVDEVSLGAVTKLGPSQYQVDFDYNVGKRKIKWIVARLPVNPEATINF